MSRCCFAPGCKTGYKSGPKGVSCFRVPKDEKLLQKWKRCIPPRSDGKQLHSKAVVCEKHFDDRFIVKYYEYIINNEVVRLERGKHKLTDDAYPTIFPDSPKYYTRRLPKKRTPPARNPLPPPKKKNSSNPSVRRSVSIPAREDDVTEDTVDVTEVSTATPKDLRATRSIFKERASPRKRVEVREAETQTAPEPPKVVEVTPLFPYEDLPLPSKQWAKHVVQEKPRIISYSACSLSEKEDSLKTDKLIVIADKGLYAECKVYIDGVRVPALESPSKKDEDHATTVLERIHGFRKCTGFADLSEFPFARESKKIRVEDNRLYHIGCQIALTTRGPTCSCCIRARSMMKNREIRMKYKEEHGEQAREPTDVIPDVTIVDSADACDVSQFMEVVSGIEDLMHIGSCQYAMQTVPNELLDDCNKEGTSNGKLENTVQEATVKVEVPYETVVSGPLPIYVV